jgi:large subunit ribosomal protein L4
MKLNVVNMTGASAGEIEFADDLLIKNGKGTQAVHDAVVAHLANRRQGTSKVKQIGDVAGSGKKPFRQKHTGRARAGSFASPLWRGGGVVFGPHPRDYTIKVPQKVRTLALRKALSERLMAGDVLVVDQVTVDTHKTRELAQWTSKLTGKSASVLVLVEAADAKMKLAARNLESVRIERADSVNCYQLLNCAKIIATRDAVAKLQERLGRS